MCGIVAYFGKKQAESILYDGLSRLEYRGYDSAGIAVLGSDGIDKVRAEGKLKSLQDKLKQHPLLGSIGIAHTRWATHGAANENNAHPHQVGQVCVVHNGIIENYHTLKNEFKFQSSSFYSQTDTEVIAHVFDYYLKKEQNSQNAFLKTLAALKGSYALAILIEDEEVIYAARRQSPLVFGTQDSEFFLASDVAALLPYTRQVIYLEDGDCLKIGAGTYSLFDLQGNLVKRNFKDINWNLAQAEKEGYKHFMLKEIFESPRAYSDTLRSRLQLDSSTLHVPDLEKLFQENNFTEVSLIACGTSYHAALIAKFYLESFLKIPILVDYASEFRYRQKDFHSKHLLIAISQSGETADTLLCVKKAKEQAAKIISICNVIEASIPRESHYTLYTHAGPEIGVAATKTFIAQVEALLLLSLIWQQAQGSKNQTLLGEMPKLVQGMQTLLESHEVIKKIASHFLHAKNFLFIGRGLQYPIALEAALKLKEISYLHAEGYPAGELKHGPIALIEQGTPVIAIVLKDQYYEKMLGNVQEVLARGASVFSLKDEEDGFLEEKSQFSLKIPNIHPFLAPLLTIIPLQLLAYEIANQKGLDVDQPRNLAKSVTVE